MVEGIGLENRRVFVYLAGSNPVPLFATVAQWVERPFCTWEVTGSSPVGCIK